MDNHRLKTIALFIATISAFALLAADKTTFKLGMGGRGLLFSGDLSGIGTFNLNDGNWNVSGTMALGDFVNLSTLYPPVGIETIDLRGCTASIGIYGDDCLYTTILGGENIVVQITGTRNYFTDFHGLSALQLVSCDYIQSTAPLDFTGCTSLTTINVTFYAGSTVILNGCSNLESILCTGSYITSCDITGCAKLYSIEIGEDILPPVTDMLSKLVAFTTSNGVFTAQNYITNGMDYGYCEILSARGWTYNWGND